jgi:uncharacterized delta-60 repeat protein
MKRVLLPILLICLFLPAAFSQINIQWQVRYTSSGANVDRAQDMFMDPAGNVYVTGIGRGASGNFDYVTIKYNAAGAQQWVAEYNGPGNGLDEAHAITVDTSGNVYVTGWSYGGATPGYDYATIKYNSAGVEQWAARYNHTFNGTDEAWDVGVDYAGNVYVTGTSDQTATNSAAATVKYSPAGAQLNLIRYNGAGNGIDAGYAIYVEPATGINYVTGYTFQSTAADFNFITLKYSNTLVQQWATMYDGPAANYDEARSIAVDGAGNVYVTGYSQTAVLTNYDFSTVKYNAAGVQQWARNYNGTGNDYDRANAVRIDAAGNVYVTGKSVGAGAAAEDVYTIKYDNAGTEKWSVRYNGPSNGYDEGKALAIDASGNVYITGYSYTAGLNNDYLTIKYDSTGVQQWLTKYNGTGNNADQAAAIEVDNAGNVFITGFSKGSGSVEDYQTIKYCQLEAEAGSDDTICTGASTMLNASALGAVAYAWLPTTGLSDPSIASPIANPTTTTTYTVAITNAGGCVDIDTVRLTVLPLPAPSITPSGPTSFCLGGSVTLTAASASTYQWSTSPADTLQSITVDTSGTFSVLVSNGFGCSSSASQTVTVFALPPINAGPDDSTCLSTNVFLSASGGASYVWHPGATLSDSTIFNPEAGPVVTTTYTVVGTASGGCQNIDSVTITILGNPGVPTITKSWDTLTSSPAFSYQWYYNGNPISGANSQTYIYTMNGNYYVEVFNNLGCSTVSTPISINDVGIAELSDAGIRIYPNPAAEFVIVEIEKSASASHIELIDLRGQVVGSYPVAGNSDFRTQISLSEFSGGIYFLRIHSSEGVLTKKIVHQ